MKCIKLQLQERTRVRHKSEPRHDRPRRYCQKLLVDPRFHNKKDGLQRFRCVDYDNVDTTANARNHYDGDDIFLSVQTLKFNGVIHQTKRPRTSFKYKTMTGGQKHRMFVKEVVDESVAHGDGDRASELTCYYFDDYAKYFVTNEPSSSKSSLVLHHVEYEDMQNKSGQVDFDKVDKTRKDKNDLAIDVLTENNAINAEDAKIAFHRCGKRKSIIISKAESPDTVQVIRVDVVRNYSCSSTMSDYEENKKQSNTSQLQTKENKKDEKHFKRTNFGHKYLLTKSVKALDENVSGGANVTLHCKTFRLADRSKTSKSKKPIE